MRMGRLNVPGLQPRGSIAILLFSAALLIPCFWQSRIQSADLSSHIYNAWLATRIHQGIAPGLWISPQSNNILFDVMLEWFLVRVGPSWAQRIAVSVSVLVFGWSAAFFVFRAAGRNWWVVAPCIAMLAYGFIFHMGFFNFYLSTGFCLWYLGIVWGKSLRVHAFATPILVLAYVAHPFPLVWGLAAAVYGLVAARTKPPHRPWLLLLGFSAILAARFILTHRYAFTWSINQLTFISGANQLALFDLKYTLPVAGILLIWAILLHNLIKRQGLANLASSIPFQLWLLNAAAVVLIPDAILFPHFGRPLSFIAQRLSLGAGLMMIATVAQVSPTRAAKVALVSLTLLFFGFLFADERQLNHREDQLDAALHAIPPSQRVIASLTNQSLRSLCFHHALDRACIGRCFSYANHEPSSLQFRIRARADNRVVLDDRADVDAVSAGTYKVQSRDLPLYLAYPCGLDLAEVCTRPLKMGESSGAPL
jgi:hypothetical protein